MNIGHAIRICRQGRGYTLGQLADSSNVSASHLCLIEQEKREPSFSVVKQIADALNVPLSVLVFLAASKQELPGFSEQQIDNLSRAIMGLMDDASRQEALF